MSSYLDPSATSVPPQEPAYAVDPNVQRQAMALREQLNSKAGSGVAGQPAGGGQPAAPAGVAPSPVPRQASSDPEVDRKAQIVFAAVSPYQNGIQWRSPEEMKQSYGIPDIPWRAFPENVRKEVEGAFEQHTKETGRVPIGMDLSTFFRLPAESQQWILQVAPAVKDIILRKIEEAKKAQEGNRG